MAALNREAISSNWKKLQEKIKSQEYMRKQLVDSEPTQDKAVIIGIKRKRSSALQNEPTRNTRGFEKDYRLNSARRGIKKRRMMGNILSSTAAESDMKTRAEECSSLVRDHDISQTDLAAAYGVPATAGNSLARPEDAALTNCGLCTSHKAGRYIALDCEMVGTGPPPSSDNLLARVSLVNYHGQLLYDSYVLPFPADTPVTDYRTAYSGIQPAHLEIGVARPFPDVQADVSTLLKDRVLIGHALRNDMAVLMLSHPKRDLRDTARHPKYRIASKGKAPALRNLAREELHVKIQTGEHSSVEDARAAMMLYQKEKAGFEEENRKMFGQPRKKVDAQGKEVSGKKAVARRGEVVDKDDRESNLIEDEDEEDLLGDVVGMGDNEDEVMSSKTSTVPAKSKRKPKRKKRTKRK